jgi:16S rRNA (guanine966-N2)-methyltransferase
MRVISGRMKGRKLSALPGPTVRPTADRVKEAMFSILAHKPVAANVLDLFAGSGALGIEAISRGACSAVFLDRSPAVLKILRQNLNLCNIGARATVVQWDIQKNLNCLTTFPHPFDLIFMDPPYGQALVAKTIKHLINSEFLSDNATIVAEHEPGMEIDLPDTALTLSDNRRYGSNQLSFIEYHRRPPTVA